MLVDNHLEPGDRFCVFVFFFTACCICCIDYLPSVSIRVLSLGGYKAGLCPAACLWLMYTEVQMVGFRVYILLLSNVAFPGLPCVVYKDSGAC